MCHRRKTADSLHDRYKFSVPDHGRSLVVQHGENFPAHIRQMNADRKPHRPDRRSALRACASQGEFRGERLSQKAADIRAFDIEVAALAPGNIICGDPCEIPHIFHRIPGPYARFFREIPVQDPAVCLRVPVKNDIQIAREGKNRHFPLPLCPGYSVRYLIKHFPVSVRIHLSASPPCLLSCTAAKRMLIQPCTITRIIVFYTSSVNANKSFVSFFLHYHEFCVIYSLSGC